MASDAIQLEAHGQMETFRWNEAEYLRLIRVPVMGNLIRRAIRVEASAKSGWSASSPSEPGAKPAVVTGRLRGSITWHPGIDELSPYVDVGSGVVYAPYVELGTRFMAARPYLRPALEAARAVY